MLIRDNSTPYTLERVEPAIQVAINVVNSEILNSSYRLVPVLRAYDNECNARNGTGLGDSGIFVDKTVYPTLTRFAYCQCHARQVISVIFRKFNWTEVILVVDTEHPQYQILGNSLRDGLQKENIHPHFLDLRLKDNIDKKIDYIRRHSRVVILVVSGDTLREFLLRCYELGHISTGEYVFLEILPFPFPGDYWGNHDWRRGDSRDPDAKKAYEVLLRISLFEPTSENWTNFTELVIREANKTYNFDFKGEQVNFYIGAFYDGVIRYGHLVKQALDLGIHYTDGYSLSRLCWNKTFTGGLPPRLQLRKPKLAQDRVQGNTYSDEIRCCMIRYQVLVLRRTASSLGNT
ncbi:atrial natriuretic peptide receptor 3-like [Gigantopelta aegis]|uniref:atrial natriuretic peptide receptor 3-like n=1 Tax=Gigantopelta aegis TaxID=1735272 RepID=UPI001B88D0CA|nr:atrial natriuretic peptide receptor 3-like [Gigantopelta aegis]